MNKAKLTLQIPYLYILVSVSVRSQLSRSHCLGVIGDILVTGPRTQEAPLPLMCCFTLSGMFTDFPT